MYSHCDNRILWPKIPIFSYKSNFMVLHCMIIPLPITLGKPELGKMADGVFWANMPCTLKTYVIGHSCVRVKCRMKNDVEWHGTLRETFSSWIFPQLQSSKPAWLMPTTNNVTPHCAFLVQALSIPTCDNNKTYTCTYFNWSLYSLSNTRKIIESNIHLPWIVVWNVSSHWHCAFCKGNPANEK